MIVIVNIIELNPSIKSSNDNKLNRFYEDKNQEVRLAMCKQLSKFLFQNCEYLKDEMKICLLERLSDIAPIIRRAALQNLCSLCVRNPNLFSEDNIILMLSHINDKDEYIQQLTVTGLSNIYKTTISSLIVNHNTFQLSSIKKQYNDIKRFCVIPNDMIKVYLNRNITDLVFRSLQENIIPSTVSVSLRSKVLIATLIEMDEESRTTFIKLLKYKHSSKKVFIEFLKEKEEGKVSDITIDKCRDKFNLTITQLRKLEKTNNQKLNDLLSDLVHDDISYEDSFHSFLELTKDKTWGKRCYITIYAVVGAFIVNKEIMV